MSSRHSIHQGIACKDLHLQPIDISLITSLSCFIFGQNLKVQANMEAINGQKKCPGVDKLLSLCRVTLLTLTKYNSAIFSCVTFGDCIQYESRLR